mgnify:CR=1 FL=1
MIDHDPNDYPAPPAWGDLSDSQQLRQIRDAEDAQEGPRAFIERRDPIWKGR